MLHNNKFFKFVAVLVAVVFLVNTCCYGLAVPPASQNPLVKREVLSALSRTQIRYAESPEAIELLKANNASCLLLSSGKYLVTKEIADNDLKLLRGIIHEDIEAIMQILAKENQSKYQGIKRLILKYFPPNHDNNLPIDLYVNHTVARAFEWLCLTEDRIVLVDEMLQDERDFVAKIKKIVNSNRHNYFTAEFWDSSVRAGFIRSALNRGTIFYTVAKGDDLKQTATGYRRTVETVEIIREMSIPVVTGEEINCDLIKPQANMIPVKSEEAEIKGYAEKELRKGSVALITVAGGMSSRAGIDYPKGMHPITPLSGKTLFESRAEELAAAKKYFGKQIVWIIMTSELNDEVTRRYFDEQNYFGLDRKNIIFIKQESIPALEADTQVVAMKDRDNMLTTPNGHGGLYRAMRDAKARTDGGTLSALEETKKRGITAFIFCQVDNPLPVIDRLALGYHITNNSDFTNIVVRKRDVKEGMGMMAVDTKSNVKFVIEYNQPAAEKIREREGFEYGATGRYIFSYEFLAKAHEPPYRMARGKKSAIFRDGQVKQGLIDKFESFVFDTLPEAENSISVVLPREECFSPFKNMEGLDSPETVRRAISDYWKRLIGRAFPNLDIPESTIMELPWEACYMTPPELRAVLVSIGFPNHFDKGIDFYVSPGFLGINRIQKPSEHVEPAAVMDGIRIAAQLLSEQHANIIFEKNHKLDRWLFRRGAIEIEIPQVIVDILSKKMGKIGERAILFTVRSQPARALEQALREALINDKSFQESFSQNGITNSFRYKKVLLIPPYGDSEGHPLKYLLPHHGVETIAYRLIREVDNIDARVYNPNLGSKEELYEFVQREGFDVIGFSVLNTTLKENLRIIGKIHTLSPDSLIVLGGQDVYGLRLDDVFSALPCDICVMDDGTSLVEIAKELSVSLSVPFEDRLQHIPNIVMRTSRGLYRSPQAEVSAKIFDVQGDIPVDKPDVTHGKSYHDFKTALADSFVPLDRIGRSPLPLLYGNFCHGRCIFCSLRRNNRPSPPADEVLDKIQRYHQKHDSINFDSSDFLMEFDKVKELIKRLKNGPFAAVPKKVTACVESIGDGKILEEMAQAGFKLVAYGIESFDNNVLRRIGKGTTREQNIRALELTLKAGIRPGMNLMLFTPWDTLDTTMDTIEQSLGFVKQGAYVNVVPFMRVMPGTPLSRMEKYIEYETCNFEGMEKELKVPIWAKVLDEGLRRIALRTLEIEKILETDYPPFFANTVTIYSLLLFKAFYLSYGEAYGYTERVKKGIKQVDEAIEFALSQMEETAVTGALMPFDYRGYKYLAIPESGNSSSLRMEEYIDSKFPQELLDVIKGHEHRIEIHRGPQSSANRYLKHLTQDGYDVVRLGSDVPRIRSYYLARKGDERIYIIANDIGDTRELFVAQVLKFYGYPQERVAIRAFPFDLRSHLLKRLNVYSGKIKRVIIAHEIGTLVEPLIKKVDPKAKTVSVISEDFIHARVMQLRDKEMVLVCEIEDINGAHIKPMLEFFADDVERRGLGVKEVVLYGACGSLNENAELNDLFVPIDVYKYGDRASHSVANAVEQGELNKFIPKSTNTHRSAIFTIPTVLSSSIELVQRMQGEETSAGIELELAHAVEALEGYPDVKLHALYEVHDKPVNQPEHIKKDTVGADVPGLRNAEKREDNVEGILRYLFHVWDLEDKVIKDVARVKASVKKLPKIVFTSEAVESEAVRVVEQIQQADASRHILIGIGGLAGAGKSLYLAPKLMEGLSRRFGGTVAIIRGDRFVIPKSERPSGLTYPQNLIDIKKMKTVLGALREGKRIGFSMYDPDLRNPPKLDGDVISALRQKELPVIRLPYYKNPLFLIDDYHPEYRRLLVNHDSSLAADLNTGDIIEVLNPNKKIFVFEVTAALLPPELRDLYDFSVFTWSSIEKRRERLLQAKARGERYLYYGPDEIEKRFQRMQEEEDPVLLPTIENADVLFVNENEDTNIEELIRREIERGSPSSGACGEELIKKLTRNDISSIATAIGKISLGDSETKTLVETIVKILFELHENISVWGHSPYTQYISELPHDPFYSVYTVDDYDLSGLTTFLPQLAEICETPSRFVTALNIEVALAYLVAEEEIHAKHRERGYHDLSCPDYQPDADSCEHYIRMSLNSVLKKLHTQVNDHQKIQRFIDTMEKTLNSKDRIQRALKGRPKSVILQNLATWILSAPKTIGWEDFISLAVHGVVSESLRKCLVLDCDGLLWDGIIGEDGIDGIKITPAHIEFQKKIKELREQGIILAINSKNNLEDVEKILEQHSGMVLKKSDFVVIRANWQDKATNLKDIAQELNIGIDSIVFFDDSPHERELVRRIHPEILIPDLPKDAEKYADFLNGLGAFKQEVVTTEDRKRAELYALREQREKGKEHFVSLEEYYHSLGMIAVIREGEENLPHVSRIAQLTQRTNQFNLTLKKYTEEDIRQFITDKPPYSRSKYGVYSLELIDKFGNHGIVGVIILDYTNFDKTSEAVIDTFCLSCRAIGLGIEKSFLVYVVNRRQETVYRGDYNRGKRNILVRDLYTDLGFDKTKASEDAAMFHLTKGREVQPSLWIKTMSFRDYYDGYNEARDSEVREMTDVFKSMDNRELAEKLLERGRQKGFETSFLSQTIRDIFELFEDPKIQRKALELELAYLGLDEKILKAEGTGLLSKVVYCSEITKVLKELERGSEKIVSVEMTDTDYEPGDSSFTETYEVIYIGSEDVRIEKAAVPLLPYLRMRAGPDNLRQLVSRTHELSIVCGLHDLLKPDKFVPPRVIIGGDIIEQLSELSCWKGYRKSHSRMNRNLEAILEKYSKLSQDKWDDYINAWKAYRDSARVKINPDSSGGYYFKKFEEASESGLTPPLYVGRAKIVSGLQLIGQEVADQIGYVETPFERVVLKNGGKVRTFVILGAVGQKDRLNIAVEEGTSKFFVIKKLISEDEEEASSSIPHVMSLLPKGYKGVYEAQLMSAGKNKWAGLEEAWAVVYPYVRGSSFETFFKKYYQDKPLKDHSAILYDVMVKIIEICAFLEERKVKGVWDINDTNIIISSEDGNPVLMDYTEKNVDPIQALEYLFYSVFADVNTLGIKGLILRLEFVSDPDLNQRVIQMLQQIHEKVATRAYSSINGFLEDFKKVMDMITEKATCQKRIEEDAESVKVLFFDYLHAALAQDRAYEIRYDASRLSASQIEIVEDYGRLLQAKSSNPGNIRLKPFSSAQGSKESLIAVYCTGEKFKGEGHVDVELSEGSIEDYLLRLTGMVNIALAASSIPDNATQEELTTTYGPIIGFIKNQYKAILGSEIAIPNSAADILNTIRYITLILPKAYRMPPNAIEEHNTLARKALVAV